MSTAPVNWDEYTDKPSGDIDWSSYMETAPGPQGKSTPAPASPKLFPEVEQALRGVPRPAPPAMPEHGPTGELPGSFEGHPENLGELAGQYLQAGPVTAATGVARAAKAAAKFPAPSPGYEARGITHGTGTPPIPDEPRPEFYKGLSEAISGAGTTALPFVAPAAAAAPVATAVDLAAGYGLSHAAGAIAQKSGASPEAEDFWRTAGFWFPATRGMLAKAIGLKTASISGPGVRGEAGSAFGGKAGYVAGVTPDEFAAGVKVGPFSGGVRIPRTRSDAPLPGPPTLEGQVAPPDNPLAQAAASMVAKTWAETQAAQTVAGVPPPPPPPPPPQPPSIHEVSQSVVSQAAKAISALPPELRVPAMIEAHGTLSKILTEQRKVVGPDGQLHIIRNPQDGERVAQTILNGEVSRQDKLAAEEAAKKAAKAERPAEQVSPRGPAPENIVSRAAGLRETPIDKGTGAINWDEYTEKPGEDIASSTLPGPKTGREAFAKGDRVQLSDGTKAQVIFTHPSQSIVRVKTDDGKKLSVGISKVKAVGSAVPVQVGEVSRPTRARWEAQESGVPSASAWNKEQLPGGVPERQPQGGNQPQRAEKVPAEVAPVHKNNSTQINLPDEVATKIKTAGQSIIPDKDLASVEGSDSSAAKGREGQPHITVKYGVNDQAAEVLREKLAEHPPFEATLGKIRTFPPTENSDGAAVVHAEVNSPELKKLHAEIDKHVGSKKDDFDYEPHLTLAYIKPEVAHKYEGRSDLEGTRIPVKAITVSQKDGKQVEVPLGGKPDIQAAPRSSTSPAPVAQPTHKQETLAIVEGDQKAIVQSQIKDLKRQAEDVSAAFSSKGEYSPERTELAKKYNEIRTKMREREDHLARLSGQPTHAEKSEARKKEAEKPFDQRPPKALKYDQPEQSQHWQVLEPDYIEKRFEQKAKTYEKGVAEKKAEIKKLKPLTKAHSEAMGTLKFWEGQLQRYKDRDPRQAESFKKEYVDLVKKAVSHGSPVPDEVIDQHSEFTLAKTARERYEKGRHTSFANKSVAINDTMQKEEGFKVKRQDGKPITEAQIKEISDSTKEIESILGPIADIMRGVDLTVVHTNGTFPFLMNDAAGLFSTLDRRITVGLEGITGKPIPVFAHEFGHMVDIKAGDLLGEHARVYSKGGKGYDSSSLAEAEGYKGKAGLIKEAQKTINNVREVRELLRATKTEDLTPEEKEEIEFAKVKLGPYFYEPREVFARLFEQYIANQIGKRTTSAMSPTDYARTVGYWTQEQFDKLKPQVEQEIQRRMTVLRERYAPSEVTPAEVAAATSLPVSAEDADVKPKLHVPVSVEPVTPAVPEVKRLRRPSAATSAAARKYEAIIAEAYKPGNVVQGYGGPDKVLEFKPEDPTKPDSWSVKVIRVDKAGNPVAGEEPRWHHTPPERADLAAAEKRLEAGKIVSPGAQPGTRRLRRPGGEAVAQAVPIAGLEGSETTLTTPTEKLPAKYKVVEAADLQPSHNAHTFGRNPKYPEGVQERTYDTSKEAQARVIQQAQNYDPNYTINTNPDAVNGPPIITPDGTVLGGNSRAMSTQRLYKAGEGNNYKGALLAQAKTFGLDKEAIRAMKEPVLVREIAQPENLEATRRLGSDLNKSMTGALGVSEKAVSAGKSITRDSLAKVAAMMDDLGADTSLRELMRERGNDLVSLLVKDGAITERERPQFVDTATGGLSEEGKTFVERALLGSVVDDPRLMDSVPKSVLNRLDSSLAALSSLSPRTDAYNIMPLVRSALHDHAEIASLGSNVETFLNQSGLFGGERNPAIDAVTRLLAEKPSVVKQKLRQFAEDAGFDVQGQATLGLTESLSPAKAFNEAFGTKLTEEELADSILQAAQAEPIIGGSREAGISRSTEASARGVQQRPTGETRPSSTPGTGTSAQGSDKPEAGNQLDFLTSESGSFEPGKLAEHLQPKPETKRARDIQESLYDLQPQKEADIIRGKREILAARNQGMTREDDEKLYHHLEDPESVPLTSKQDDFLDDIILPLVEKNNALYEEASGGGFPIENYVSRSVKGKNGLFDRIVAGVKSIGRGSSLSRSAPQLKQRIMMALVNDQGERMVVSLKGGQVTAWKNGAPENLGPIMTTQEGKAWKDSNGEIWRLEQATTKEIEANTELRYHHSAMASLVASNIRLQEVVRAMRLLNSLKQSPDFSDWAMKQGEGAPPDGWKTTTLPQFNGYYLEPRTAEVFDWFDQRFKTGDLNALDALSVWMRAKILMNPLKHPLNIAAQWAIEKGVTGVLPHRWPTMIRSGVKAINAVWSQNDDFLAALDEGAPMQSAHHAARDLTRLLYQQLADATEKGEPWATKLADALGFDRQHMGNLLHKMSSKVAWPVSDMLFLEAAFEKQAAGMPLKDALRETGKTIPTYRLPTRIADSQALGKIMSNKWATIFGSYHYGLLKSFSESVRDALGGGTAGDGQRSKASEVAKGWDRLAMMALGALVFYPLADKLLQSLTKDKHAKTDRSGLFGLIDAVHQVARGEQSLGQAARRVLTPNPVVEKGAELLFDRDFFSGRQIHDPTAPASEQAAQVGSYLAKQLVPFGEEIQQARRQPEGWKRLALSQVNVRFPKTRAERVAAEIRAAQGGMEAQTLSDENLYILRERALNALRDGDESLLDEGLADGTISEGQAHLIRERAELTPIQDAVHGFKYDKLMRVYDAADDDEKDELQPIVDKKYRSLLRANREDELAAAEP